MAIVGSTLWHIYCTRDAISSLWSQFFFSFCIFAWVLLFFLVWLFVFKLGRVLLERIGREEVKEFCIHCSPLDLGFLQRA